MELHDGQTFTAERTYSTDDIGAFARASGDLGDHHLTPGPDGRVMAHGLHIAALATEIGGSVNFIARTMHFEFSRPVYSGDTITCTGTMVDTQQLDDRTKGTVAFRFTNQHDECVATGGSDGIVYAAAPASN